MTGFRPPDQGERDLAEDPRRNVVLRASAGTGKTTVLTSRYLRLLEAGVPPRNILALTFTRQAAQEMKDRILLRLGEPERRRRLGGSARLAEVAISTIDAFTLGLVREFPLDAGVSPGVEVLDERAMPAVREEALGRVFSGATGVNPDLLGSLPLLVNGTAAGVRKAAARYLDKRLVWRRLFERKAARSRGRPVPPLPVLREGLREAAGSCSALLAAGDPPFPPTVRFALRRPEQGSSRDALDREVLEAWCRLGIKTAPRGFPKRWKPDYLEVKKRVRVFRRRWQEALNERAFFPMWKVLQAVEAEYQRLKRERGVMDFDDLTVAATRLLSGLGEFSDSRFRLESRYHHLLLDEFHDTSDHQWDLLRTIVDPWAVGAGLAAEAVREVTRGRLRRPTIFVVGDHKQSIYRFRDARVEILSQAERAIAALDDRREAGGGRGPGLVLRFNFRSVRRLRRFVNRASKHVARAPRGADPGADWAFRYDDSDAFPESAGPKDEKAPSPGPVVSVAVGRNHREIAARIAERIRTLIRDRRAAPDEIAVLARAGTHLGSYRQALEERGIAAHLLKGRGLFDTSEVRDLRALCRFLARPWSDLRAVEVLRSRFFAVPGASLADLRERSDGETPFADLLRSGGAALPAGLPARRAEALRRAGRETRGWVRLARRLPPARTVARILERTRYLRRAELSAPTLHEGRQEAANLKKALRLLRAFERQGFASMERVADSLEAAAHGDSTQEPLEAAEAVQLLSIHAAKGLEWDHVFLVDCTHRGGGRGGIPRVQERASGRWNIALVSDAPGWALDDGGRSDAEERRCLYVAMTRARLSLCLSWTGFTHYGNPVKNATGLAFYLPKRFFAAATGTAAAWKPGFAWEGEEIEVLPVPPDDGPEESPAA